MTHAQPCLTKNTLNILLFFAKYDGAVFAKWDCVVVLYGDALAAGSRRAKREPTSSVAGYIERSTVSTDVGRNGDLRVGILVGSEGMAPESVVREKDLFAASGNDESFWVRGERRGVTDGESICYGCYNMGVCGCAIGLARVRVKARARVTVKQAASDLTWRPRC